MADPMAEVAPLPVESTAHLNRRESYDYREYCKHLPWWLLNFGTDPERGEGCAEATVESRGYPIEGIGHPLSVRMMANLGVRIPQGT